MNIEKLTEELKETKALVTELKNALLGSEFTQDRGILWRLDRVESKIKDFTAKLEDMNSERIKQGVYLNQLSYVTGGAVIIILGIIIKSIFKGS